jgi:hypothetical protein
MFKPAAIEDTFRIFTNKTAIHAGTCRRYLKGYL